ncbi:putative nuclease HARBI1 [Hyla sarda]|uniref:putative nuclease HARBI1 n=1 Tax=Hyla sarda TaxID=327740 RepID=UPI0024C3DC56|nr:putative nuclease HARBI1 [Hyla sarda]
MTTQETDGHGPEAPGGRPGTSGPGIFQHCSADQFGINSQPSFSRILGQVLQSMMRVAQEYIKFPQTTEEIQSYKEAFYNIAGMPNVLGIIDCTHAALIPPARSERAYRNRKLYQSINVQIVVGPYLNIIDVVPNYPGSCHDAFILRNTELYARFQHGVYGDSCLLGDNGYRLSRWLLTPYLNPRTREEERFNRAHKRTRAMIEYTFGLLKSRCRCLDITGGALKYKPQTVCKIIIACCMLHNIAQNNNIPAEFAQDLREEIGATVETQEVKQDSQAVRQHITAHSLQISCV